MSKFTKADAKAAGWLFVHEQPEVVEELGDGITRTTPASFRAEKPLTGGGMLNEQAESLQKLIERIGHYEGHLEQKGVDQQSQVVVATPSHLNDAIFDGAGMTFVRDGEIVEPEQGAWAEIDSERGIEREVATAEDDSAEDELAEEEPAEEGPAEGDAA